MDISTALPLEGGTKHASGTKAKDILLAGLVFAAYVVIAELNLSFYGQLSLSLNNLMWVPAGIALALLLLKGYRYWVVIAAASLFVSFSNDRPLVSAIFVALGNVLQPVTAVYFLRRFNFDLKLQKPRDLFLFLTVAALASAISPSFAEIGRWINRDLVLMDNIGRWASWWLGQYLSVLIITPFLTTWFTIRRFAINRKNFFEYLAVFLVVAGLSYLIFWMKYNLVFGTVATVYLLLVPLFWAGIRLGIRAMTFVVLFMTVFSLSGFVYGVASATGLDATVAVLRVELFFVVIAIMFLILSTVSTERREAIGNLSQNLSKLETAIKKINSVDKSKNDFIAMLAHELRNPLAAMLSYLQILQLTTGKEKGAKLMDNVQNITLQVNNMSRLLDDLLDTSRISQGKIVLKKELVDVRETIKRSVTSMGEFIESNNHKLHLDLQPDPVWVVADPLRLEQIFINILSNAAKYTEPGGQIWLSCYVINRHVVVKVRDNGIGINESDLGVIFEMFGVAKHTAGVNRGGLGIGLKLVKNLTEMHGGTVEARSDGLGKGSEFVVSIPARREVDKPSGLHASAPELALEANADRRDEHKKLRILVVDDNKAAADSMANLLNFLKHETIVSYSGQDAIEKAQFYRPDIVLLDLGLPGMDGCQVARILKQDDACSDIVLVALTGYGQDEDKLKTKEAGFDHHLVKPVSIAQIRDILSGLPNVTLRFSGKDRRKTRTPDFI